MLQNQDVLDVYRQALELARGQEPSATNITRVASSTTQEASRWAFLQWDLRRRARVKFALADQMLFDRDGLEMASHERVAEYHASLFPSGVTIADLTVGIGADLIALAARGPAFGFEVDKNRAAMARHNLEAHGVSAEIHLADCLEDDWQFRYAFADPARRRNGQKRLELEQYEPNLAVLATRMSTLDIGLIKLSPLMQNEALRNLGGSIQFVSYEGECREALVILGSLAAVGDCQAVQIESGASLGTSSEADTTDLPMEWFYEADPAAIRVGGLGGLCNEHCLMLLGDSNGYLTGSNRVESQWLKRYDVLFAGAGDVAATKRELQAKGSSTPDVKTRGKGLDADALRKSWRMTGGENLHVAAYRVGPKIKHVILRRS